jgi:gas vesicle protein
METIYFFVGAVTVAVVFAIVWLLRVVSSQIKQIQDLERGLESVVSNDITESDVRAIVDSRVDKYASNVEREFEKTVNYVDSLNNNQYDNLNEVHRRIDDVVRELKNEININRVTNTRRVTNSDLQSEY